MKFTGHNLQVIAWALNGAINDCFMQIGSCPDVFEYAEYIDSLRADQALYEKLLVRIYKRHPELNNFE